MKQWRILSLSGILFGNIALLIDYFVIPIPHVIMIPVLLVGCVMIFAGLIMSKKQKKT